MRLVLLCFLLGPACATTQSPRGFKDEVKYLDDSRDAALHVCREGKGGTFECLEFNNYVHLLQQKIEEGIATEHEQNLKPISKSHDL